MSEIHSPDATKKLVKFLIYIAILGTIIALVAYFIVLVPGHHAALLVPHNADPTLVDGQIT
jgi:hypothetical protein